MTKRQMIQDLKPNPNKVYIVYSFLPVTGEFDAVVGVFDSEPLAQDIIFNAVQDSKIPDRAYRFQCVEKNALIPENVIFDVDSW